jgi:hypothetical protein
MLALEEWLTFAAEIGAIDERERDALQEKAAMAIMAAIEGQADHLATSDPVDRYRDLLRDAIASGSAHVRAPGDEPGAGFHLGFVRPDGLYLYPEAALSLAKDIAETLGDPLPFSGQTMNRRLLDRGWLVSTNLDKKRRSVAVRRKMEGKMQTLLHLKPEFL